MDKIPILIGALAIGAPARSQAGTEPRAVVDHEHFEMGDANHDGFLDPAEFTAHALARLEPSSLPDGRGCLSLS